MFESKDSNVVQSEIAEKNQPDSDIAEITQPDSELAIANQCDSEIAETSRMSYEHESDSEINAFASTSNPSTSTGSSNDFPEFDLGNFLGKSTMSRSKKIDVLKKCWAPPISYDFSQDVADSSKRIFMHSWLETYAPWLCYSKKLKGALCLYCVLFPPLNVQGVLGAFIVTPFVRYKHTHDYCRNHAASQ